MTDNKWVLLLIASIAGLMLALWLWLAFVKPAEARINPNDWKVTICHHNNGIGWTTNNVDSSSIDGIGNGDHNRSGHQGGQDIIPPFYNNGFTGYWHSRNWDADGQAVWKNDCKKPEQEPSPEPTKPPEPTPTDIPEPTPTDEPEPTTTPEPTATPTKAPVVVQRVDTTSAPVCTDGSTSKLVANLHVWRNGTQADVNFFITEGNHANIYYKVNGSDGWQHAVTGLKGNSDNYVSYTINDLDANLGYTFGVQQTIGCGTGDIATAVVVDPPAQGRLFHFSFWQW